jgi:hypothetical protein
MADGTFMCKCVVGWMTFPFKLGMWFTIFIKLLTNAMPLVATSKARIFKLHRISVLHTCYVEATVAQFTDFSKDVLR